MHIIGVVLIIALAAYAANITGDIDAVGWVFLGAPFVIPVGLFALWLVGSLMKAVFGRSSRN